MVGLVGVGRSPETLGREFEPSAQAIRNRVKHAELDEGLCSDGVTPKVRRVLTELKREVRRLRMEPDNQVKAAVWFARQSGSIP